MVQVKDGAPFSPELETPVLLNPLARATADANGSFSFPKELPLAVSTTATIGNAAIAKKLVIAATENVHGVGTDVELISAIPFDNETFLAKNFTEAELNYCRSAADFKSSLAGRWSAKEATFKSMKTESAGGGASLKDIEILADKNGAPMVILHGNAKIVGEGLTFEVSISHSEDVAIAVVLARKL